jgi:uncharacterized damage-inducible protein DinB
MPTHEYFRTLARYNLWMNQRLYELSASIPETERKRDRGAFFRSIHGTLNHLLLGDRLWLGRFTTTPFPVHSLDQELYADFDELRRERERTDAEILAWVGSLSEEQLASPLRFSSIVDPVERVLPLWFAVLHFFNHQTHHRGQLTTLLSQCGCDPGVTDLLWLPGAPVSSS